MIVFLCWISDRVKEGEKEFILIISPNPYKDKCGVRSYSIFGRP